MPALDDALTTSAPFIPSGRRDFCQPCRDRPLIFVLDDIDSLGTTRSGSRLSAPQETRTHSLANAAGVVERQAIRSLRLSVGA